MGIDERIKERRSMLGLSQTELAEILGLSAVTVSKWESGLNKPKGSHMLSLAEALGVSIDWLLNGDSQPSKTRLTKDELEIVELFRSASLKTKMTVVQILTVGDSGSSNNIIKHSNSGNSNNSGVIGNNSGNGGNQTITASGNNNKIAGRDLNT